jgi:hypothetical protein
MDSLLGTPLDQKYIGLAKLLYSLLYRSRFLGHGCCRIGPDLQGALVGDWRSYANGVRRAFVTTP